RRTHGAAGPGDPCAVAGVLPAREPEAAPAEREARAARARRGDVPGGRQDRERLDRPLFRQKGAPDRGDAGEPRAARRGRPRHGAAHDERKPRGGPELQDRSRPGASMKVLLWLLAAFALAAAISVVM